MNSLKPPEHYLLYLHRGLQYAVPVINVLEVVFVTEWLPSHSSLPGCLGNIVHRETLLPVLDSTALSTDLGGEPARSEIVVIVQQGETVFGLTLDRYLGVVPLNVEGYSPAAPEHSATSPDMLAAHRHPFVETVRTYRNNTLIMLAVPAIMEAVRGFFGDHRLLTDSGAARQPVGAVVPEAALQSFMCARIESAVLGIPVEKVREVIEGFDVTPLFKVVPSLRGLINLRGQVLACVDISGELGFPLRNLIEWNKLIVLQDNGTDMALCVDQVLGIRDLPLHSMQKAETVLSGDILHYVQSVLENEQGAVLILAVSDIFRLPQLLPYQRQEI